MESKARDNLKDERSAEIRKMMEKGDFWKQFLKEAIKILGQEEDHKSDNELASAEPISTDNEAAPS